MANHELSKEADPERRAALLAKVDRLTQQIVMARLAIISVIAFVGIAVATWVAPETLTVLFYVAGSALFVEMLVDVPFEMKRVFDNIFRKPNG